MEPLKERPEGANDDADGICQKAALSRNSKKKPQDIGSMPIKQLIQ
jgi:hypothetical protein